jgi:hypothetical protein
MTKTTEARLQSSKTSRGSNYFKIPNYPSLSKYLNSSRDLVPLNTNISLPTLRTRHGTHLYAYRILSHWFITVENVAAVKWWQYGNICSIRLIPNRLQVPVSLFIAIFSQDFFSFIVLHHKNVKEPKRRTLHQQ